MNQINHQLFCIQTTIPGQCDGSRLSWATSTTCRVRLLFEQNRWILLKRSNDVDKLILITLYDNFYNHYVTILFVILSF